MAGRYLLDTNIVVALFGGDAGVDARMAVAAEVLLPAGWWSASCASARRGRFVLEANFARIEEFSATCTVVGVDGTTAARYGLLKGELFRKGRPIPENDLWIAACALQHDLTLVTRDRHFDQVPGLQVEAW